MPPAPLRANHVRRIYGRCYYCGVKVAVSNLTCTPCKPLYEADPLGASARKAAA